MFIGNVDISTHGRFIRTARLVNEWYEDVSDPASLVETLKQTKARADLFTFWQRLPYTAPKYAYRMEWDPVAAVPVKDFDHWWRKQIDSKTRNLVRKAEKKGVAVRFADYDDEFIRGMIGIFNETPVRQGKPFWHYGKDFETVKREFSKNLHREDIIGAYHQGELIGFIMLAYAGHYAMTTQIISKIAHRDKSPTNALIAEAVRICGEKEIPYLVYARWPKGTLGDFKRNNGFEKIDLPRYYVPLNMKGGLALQAGLHRSIAKALPENLVNRLMELRAGWHIRKYKNALDGAGHK